MSTAHHAKSSVSRLEPIALPERVKSRVRALRIATNLTASGLALSCRVPAARLKAFEAGRADLDAVELRAVTRALGVRIHELFEGVA